MNDRAHGRQDPAHAGLCETCRHARVILSDRGSRFWRCERSRVDAAFPRFPPLPVVVCRGYEAAPGGAPEDD